MYSNGQRDDLLSRVASLYYEYDHSQQEIADMLRISRSNISRLLKEAKLKGLVEIRVKKRIPTIPTLELQFQERFGLKRAMIADLTNAPHLDALPAAGQLAAWYLEEILREQAVLAISWGTGVAAAVQAMSSYPDLRVDVVQMIGSVAAHVSSIDGPELARQLARKLGGQYYYLHAPLFVDGPDARTMFLSQQTVTDTLNRARKASVALVGVGTTAPSASSFLRAGHLTDAQVGALRAAGAVGESSGQHFDINGGADFDINRRVIALGLNDVQRIPHVVAVACGGAKGDSILGALRGKYINALATDIYTAQAVLEADSQAAPVILDQKRLKPNRNSR
jgi:DNA-binding transcriptional regulator LsrR (DeoR family)